MQYRTDPSRLRINTGALANSLFDSWITPVFKGLVGWFFFLHHDMHVYKIKCLIQFIIKHK